MKSIPKSVYLCISLLLLVILSYSGYRVAKSFFTVSTISKVKSVTNLNKPKQSKEIKYYLSSFESFANTNYLIASINIQGDSRKFSYESYEKDSGTTRNFMFFDIQNKSTRLLIKNNDSLFLKYHVLGEAINNKRKNGNPIQKNSPNTAIPENLNSVQNIQGLWYEVVTTDTNQDGRLGHNDQKTIAMSDISGENYTEVIQNIDNIISTHQPNAKQLLVFWYGNNKNYVSEIDILSKRVIQTRELAAIN